MKKNDLVKNYTTLPIFCEKYKINYWGVWRKLKENKNKIKFIVLDKRTKIYYEPDLVDLCEENIIKQVILEKQKTLRNPEILGYDSYGKFNYRIYDPVK